MRLPLRGGELERKLVLGLTESHLYLSVQCCLGDFFALQHPVSPSYHSKSLLFFQPGFVSPSSHHALPSLTLFLPTLAGKEEDLTAVFKLLFCVELDDGG